MKWLPGMIGIFIQVFFLLMYTSIEDSSFVLPLHINRSPVTDLESYLDERGLEVFWGYERTSEHNMAAWIAYCFGEYPQTLSILLRFSQRSSQLEMY